MDITLTTMRCIRTGLLLALLASVLATETKASNNNTQSATQTYSQKTLLKNWALSVCLAEVTVDAKTREDANATASAYLEFGHQPLEAYDELRPLITQFTSRKYGGSIEGEFNTMKCIDLFHSKALDRIARKYTKLWSTSTM